MLPNKTHHKVHKIGADVEEFEVEKPILVKVEKTLLGRFVDLAWMISATLIALTILNVAILPFFS